MDGQMDDDTDGWNDASQRPLLYVISNKNIFYILECDVVWNIQGHCHIPIV